MEPSASGGEPDRRLLIHPPPDWWYWTARGGIGVILWPVLRLYFGFRIRGRENAADISGGAVTVCNHIHHLDCVMLQTAFPRRRVWTLSLPENLLLPAAGAIVRTMGGLAVPGSAAGYRTLYRHLEDCFARGHWLHVYPEGALRSWCRELRDFHPGAFRFAQRFAVPVVPCVLRQYERRGPVRRGLELVVLPPVRIPEGLPPKEAAAALERRVRAAMEAALAGEDLAADRAAGVGGKRP